MTDCDHIIGYCRRIDGLIYQSEDYKEYLTDKCTTFPYDDVIFNYCPECGENSDARWKNAPKEKLERKNGAKK
jgi:hypothetical protein